MIHHVLILGGGSAGFLAAIALKTQLPHLDVTVIRSKEIGIIGVGEGTTYIFPIYLHGRLGIDPADFHRRAEPSWKLGIRFLNWGPRDHFDYTFRAQVTNRWQELPKANGYYCDEDFTYADVSPALMSHNKVFLRDPNGRPQIGTDTGYHIENEKFVEFLESHAARGGVKIEDDTVRDVRQDDGGIAELRMQSGRALRGDLYIDCSGFASVLLGKALAEPFVGFDRTLFCDRAVVGGWARGDEPIKPYTAAETMSAGWCWQIEHERRINRGYVYSSAFISDADAEAEFRAANPKVSSTRVVRFTSGRYERVWVKNVVAIGNASGFVEPMEATALAVICRQCDALVECLVECTGQPTPSVMRQCNKRIAATWDCIRDFLGIHYRFNTRLETPFWRECRQKTELAGAGEVVQYYQENGPGLFNRQALFDPHDMFGLEGYWSLLIGQKVPYRKAHVVTDRERAHWRKVQELFRTKALEAVSIPEALGVIRSPGFRWPPIYGQRPAQAAV